MNDATMGSQFDGRVKRASMQRHSAAFIRCYFVPSNPTRKMAFAYIYESSSRAEGAALFPPSLVVSRRSADGGRTRKRGTVSALSEPDNGQHWSLGHGRATSQCTSLCGRSLSASGPLRTYYYSERKEATRTLLPRERYKEIDNGPFLVIFCHLGGFDFLIILIFSTPPYDLHIRYHQFFLPTHTLSISSCSLDHLDPIETLEPSSLPFVCSAWSVTRSTWYFWSNWLSGSILPGGH